MRSCCKCHRTAGRSLNWARESVNSRAPNTDLFLSIMETDRAADGCSIERDAFIHLLELASSKERTHLSRPDDACPVAVSDKADPHNHSFVLTSACNNAVHACFSAICPRCCSLQKSMNQTATVPLLCSFLWEKNEAGAVGRFS